MLAILEYINGFTDFKIKLISVKASSFMVHPKKYGLKTQILKIHFTITRCQKNDNEESLKKLKTNLTSLAIPSLSVKNKNNFDMRNRLS